MQRDCRNSEVRSLGEEDFPRIAAGPPFWTPSLMHFTPSVDVKEERALSYCLGRQDTR